MGQDPAVDDVAAALHVSIGLLRWRLRQVGTQGELSLPERSAMARLSLCGPASPSELARMEQISPQGMGATLAALEARGLVRRDADPKDRRRAVMSLTDAGRKVLQAKQDARTELLADALSRGFSPDELKQLLAAAPLIERLAQTI